MEHPANDPAAVSVHPARLARAVDVLREGIAGGAMPGATVAAFRRGTLFLHEAVGTLDGTRPAQTDSLYDLASITKPMATGASLLTLVEQGRVVLTSSITDYLDDRGKHLGRITLRHLLTHTSGLPAWTACYDVGLGFDAALTAISRVPVGVPGTKYEYSCLNFILLQQVVETISGQSLDNFARENVFAPLGLADTGYKPAEALRDRIASTVPGEGPDKNTVLTGVVHDGNARGIGGVSGNAGLFGTVLDVARFGEAVRESAGKPLFGRPTLARIAQSQIDATVGAHTLLFFAQGNALCPAGDLLSPRAVGHSGYTGTFLTLDPAFDLTVAVLTNSVFLTDGKPGWLTVRRRFLNALASAIG